MLLLVFQIGAACYAVDAAQVIEILPLLHVTLALIVEGATETLRRDPAEFASTGMVVDGAKWLGAVAPHGSGLLQLVDINALLPSSVRHTLCRDLGDAA